MVTIDFMCLARAGLLRLCEELGVEVDDDCSEAGIRSEILDSNSEYLKYFLNVILNEQEKEEHEDRERRELGRIDEIREERSRQLRKEMEALDQEIEKME